MDARSARLWLGLILALIAAPGSNCLARSGFDARNPADVLEVLDSKGAGGEIKADEDGLPTIDDKLGFNVDFYDCNADKSVCKMVIYIESWDSTAVNLQQINHWNQMFVPCPAFLTAQGNPNMHLYVTASGHDTKADVIAQIQLWERCRAGFEAFLKGPDAFLKAVAADGKH